MELENECLEQVKANPSPEHPVPFWPVSKWDIFSILGNAPFPNLSGMFFPILIIEQNLVFIEITEN